MLFKTTPSTELTLNIKVYFGQPYRTLTPRGGHMPHVSREGHMPHVSREGHMTHFS